MPKFEEYKQWIFSQPHDDFSVEETNGNLLLKTDYATGEINFYSLEVLIVEMKITNNADEENKFFLHFELNDEDHAQELYKEMVNALMDLKENQTKKILLCCTSGLTTNFFAMKLNETAQYLSLPYTFNAVSVDAVYKEAMNYDAILLAPQIAYAYDKMATILVDKIVLKMPARVFASYDAAAAIEFVKDEMDRYEKTAEERAIKKIRGDIPIRGKVLVLAMVSDTTHTELPWRLYENGKVIDQAVVRKKQIDFKDIEDILDTVICSCSKYDAVSITVPGIVKDGSVRLQENAVELQESLSKKYNTKVVLSNNVNAAALGLYATQEQYHSLTLHSQPYGYIVGGQGSVINGKMCAGKHNISGEVRFLMRYLKDFDDMRADPFNPSTAMKAVTYSLIMNIVESDPEVIYVRSPLTPSCEEIKDALKEMIPEEYIPDLLPVKEYEFSEYMILGALILAMAEI